MPDRHFLFPKFGSRPRVLVPVLKGQLARPIMSIGDALLAFPGTSGSLLALIEANPNLPVGLETQDERPRDMLRWLAGLDYESKQRRRMKVVLRLSADVASSVRDAVAETRSTNLVLEWPTIRSPRRHRLSAMAVQLAGRLPADVMLVRSDPTAPNREVAPRSILAAIRGGPGARIVAATAAALADVYGCALTLIHVESASQHPDRSRREWETFEEIVEEIRRPSTAVRQRPGDSPADGILEEAAGHDLVIIGSRLDPRQPKVLVGRGLMRMVRRMQCPVVVIRPKQSVSWAPLNRAERSSIA